MQSTAKNEKKEVFGAAPARVTWFDLFVACVCVLVGKLMLMTCSDGAEPSLFRRMLTRPGDVSPTRLRLASGLGIYFEPLRCAYPLYRLTAGSDPPSSHTTRVRHQSFEERLLYGRSAKVPCSGGKLEKRTRGSECDASFLEARLTKPRAKVL